eukprot:9339557-Alexandrium_andersonii.AAC.1
MAGHGFLDALVNEGGRIAALHELGLQEGKLFGGNGWPRASPEDPASFAGSDAGEHLLCVA